MKRRLIRLSRILGAAGVLLLAGCGGDDTVPEAISSSPSLTIEATKLLFREEIDGTAPAGVFLELHYLLANESDSDLLFAQDDLRLESGSDNSYAPSPAGLEAWMRESPGYHLTEAVTLVRGSHPRPWITVFDIPLSEHGSAFAVRFRSETRVAVPEGLRTQ